MKINCKEKCRSLFLFFMFIALSINNVQLLAQNREKNVIRIGFITYSENDRKSQDYILSFFQDMVDSIRAKNKSFSYTKVAYEHIKYYDPIATIQDNTLITTLAPLKYIILQKEHNTNLIPLFITKKRDEKIPYYNAVFISNKGSSINSLFSSSIKKIFLVDSVSASGYIAPLWELYHLGIIDAPTLKALRKKGWKVETHIGNGNVVDKIMNDSTAIGAVWDFESWHSPIDAPVKVIQRYACFPQDLIVISSCLADYSDEIKNWIKNGFENDSILRDCFRKETYISGIEEYTLEHENGYNNLYYKYSTTISHDSIKKNNIYIGTLVSLLVLCIIFTLLIVFFANKSIRNKDKKKQYLTYMWASFTAIILILCEIFEMILKHLSEEHLKFFNNYFQIPTIIISISLAFIAEKRGLLVDYVMKVINTLEKFLQKIEELYKDK